MQKRSLTYCLLFCTMTTGNVTTASTPGFVPLALSHCPLPYIPSKTLPVTSHCILFNVLSQEKRPCCFMFHRGSGFTSHSTYNLPFWQPSILLGLVTLVPIAGLFLDKPLPYIPSITLSAGPRCILFSSEEKISHSTYN